MRKLGQAKRAGEESKVHRIYVGSIPGHIKQSTLLAYFENFGRILRVRMFFRDTTEKVNKGYCHVITDDRSAYDKILAHSPHYLGKRRLYCSALISGRRLEKHNLYNNTKRIILRNLPPEMTDDDLYVILSEFGAIEMAYIFKAHGLMRQNFAFTPTASVQFVDSRVANALVKKHLVEVKYAGRLITLVAYPYIHNYNELKDAVLTSSDVQAELSSPKELEEIRPFIHGLPEYLLKEELILKLKIKQEAERKPKPETQYEEDIEKHLYRPTQRNYFGENRRIANTLKVKGNYVLNRCNQKRSSEKGTHQPTQSNPQCSDLFSPDTITPRKEDCGSKKGKRCIPIHKAGRILDLNGAQVDEESSVRQNHQSLCPQRALSIKRPRPSISGGHFHLGESEADSIHSLEYPRSLSSRNQDLKNWMQPSQVINSPKPQIYSYF